MARPESKSHLVQASVFSSVGWEIKLLWSFLEHSEEVSLNRYLLKAFFFFLKKIFF